MIQENINEQKKLQGYEWWSHIYRQYRYITHTKIIMLKVYLPENI